jgi:hypothetical protein
MMCKDVLWFHSRTNGYMRLNINITSPVNISDHIAVTFILLYKACL